MLRLLSGPEDETESIVKERCIICGESAGRILFHSRAGWVDDRECALVFIRSDAAAVTRSRLEAEERGNVTNVRVEHI